MQIDNAVQGVARALFTMLLAAAAMAPSPAQTVHLSHFVAPAYTPLARQALISGEVTIKVQISKEGTITGLLVLLC